MQAIGYLRRDASMKRRSGLGLFGLVGAALGLVGCNANFIPVPPPGDPTFESVQVTDGTGATRQVWQVSGGPSDALKNARVYVFNASVGEGVITRASETGTYATGLLDGEPGDRIELHYETPEEKSPLICRLLVAGPAKTPCP